MAKLGIYKNLTGVEFGRLKAVRRIGSIRGRSIWECVCLCGNKKNTAINNLQNGHVRSCGCINKEIYKNGGTHNTHRMTGTRFYRIWIDIKTRIKNRNSRYYKHYGGRGIKNEWNDFESFMKDMYESYKIHIKIFGLRNTTIDRIDVDGNYSKKNCRWSTWREQQKNRRDSLNFTVNGLKKHISDWAKYLNIPRYTLYDRLKLRLPEKMRPPVESILIKNYKKKKKITK